VLDHGLPTQSLLDGREGAVVVVDVVADRQLGQELACARVDGGDLRRARLGDDQRVPEAGDRHFEPSPLSLELLVGGHQLVGHRVERRRELLQLPRSRRLHPGPEATRYQASRRLHEVVERRLHPADQPGKPAPAHRRSRARRRSPRAAAPVATTTARRLAPSPVGPAGALGGWLASERAWARGPDGAVASEKWPCAASCRALRLGGDLSLREPHADGIVLRERLRIPRCGGERSGSLGAGSGGARSSGVAQHLLLGHPPALARFAAAVANDALSTSLSS